MYDHLRRVARRIVRQLFPIASDHRQQPPIRDLLSTTTGRSLVTALRPRRDPAPPITWADDLPLVRPYVLSAGEWEQRRAEVRPRAGAFAA